MPRPLEDLTGRSYSSWTVLRRAPNVPTINETMWTCQCACGKSADVPRSNLLRGLSTKCVDCRNEDRRRPPRVKVVKPRIKLVGAAHPRWKGNMIAYSSAHKRVAAARGPAADHECVDCGGAALDWSFRGIHCETRMIDATNRPYCTHVEHYDPRCRDCHNRFDHP